MRKVFSSTEMPEIVLIRDALLHEGISASIQNQNSGFSAVPGFRAPAEVWVENDADFELARTIVKNTLSRMDTGANDSAWACEQCKEQNPSAFEVCWSCGAAREQAESQ